MAPTTVVKKSVSLMENNFVVSPRRGSTHMNSLSPSANLLGPAEEGSGEHQQPSGFGDEVRKVHSWLQDVPEDPALRQG